MSNWSNKWKKTLIWVSRYLSIIAFVIVGGYTIVKSQDDDLKKTTKTAFIVTLIFTAIQAFLSLFNLFGGFSNNYYGSRAYDFHDIASSVVAIAEIIVFAVFTILALVEKDNKVEIKDAPRNE